MNQRLLITRLLTMSWLLLALLFSLLLASATASNRERNGQHHQQLGRNHHHRRNNSTNPLSRTGMKRETEKVTSTAGLISTTTMENSPFLAVVENSSRKFAIKAALNGNIFMHCPVEMAEDFQVSWVRLPDWRIVASGRHIYNKDERFRVLHAEGASEWTLQIKYAALIDQGLYECQVSTGTGIMIHYYNVSVIVPTTSIVGGSEYHVDKGSAIQLTCVIKNIPQEPQFIFWYHNDRMINYDSSTGSNANEPANNDVNVNRNGSRTKTRTRPRVEVVTEIDSSYSTDNLELDQQHGRDGDADRSVTSQLTIHDVTDVDSGNYTCAPSNAEPASTMVYVSEGDDAAAAIQVSVGETTNVSDVTSSAAASAASAAPAASSSRTSASLAVLVLCYLTVANRHFHRR